MKKLSIILLAILLTVSLFVSCDNTTKAVTDEHVAVTFSTGADSRSLSYVIENVSELKWYYSAQKNSKDESPFAFGATSGTEITLGDTVEFSQGLWDFTLWAKRVNTRADGTKVVGEKVYQGSSTGVLITKNTSPKPIEINVSPVIAGVNGSIKFDGIYIALKGDSKTKNVYPSTALIVNKNEQTQTISLANGSSGVIPLTPGDYKVTVYHTETIGNDTVEYASETLFVTVWSGRETTIKGNITELTGSAIINGNIQIPTIAAISKTATAGEETIFKASVAPVNNLQSTKMESTTVSFAPDALTAGDYNLSVKVSNEVEKGINIGSNMGAVATLNLSLKNGETIVPDFNEESATITTYIAKDLTGVTVSYNGGGAQPIANDADVPDRTIAATLTSDEGTKLGYNSATGLLRFKTTHFSEFKVSAYTQAEIGGKEYCSLQTSFDVAKANDTIKLTKDVSLKNYVTNKNDVSVNVILDLNGHSITATGTAIINNGTLTIKDSGTNGTIQSETHVAIAAGDNSITTIESGAYSGREGAVITGYATGATININGGTFSASDNAVIAGNGNSKNKSGVDRVNSNTINISGGTFNGGIESSGYVACGIYAPWRDKINVSGGEFIITKGAGIVARAGNVNVSGGTFNCTGDASIIGKVGDSRITVPCSALVFDSGAKYPAMDDNSKITVSGGTFNSENDNIHVVLKDGDSNKRVVVTGGKFSSNPYVYLAVWKKAVLNDDGMYLVVDNITTEDQLKAAVENGGEINLGANITLTSSLTINKKVTLNFGEYTITADKKTAIILNDEANVTVNATTGGVSGTGSNGNCFNMASNNNKSAALTINGGNYSSTSGYFVEISAGTLNKLYINGGTYSGARIINVSPANTEISMTGGILEGTGNGVIFGTKSKNSTFTMTGGSIKYESGSVITGQAEGNTIEISRNAEVTGKLSLTNSTMNIKGGTVNITGSNTDNRALMINEGSTLNISNQAKLKGDALFNIVSETGNVSITGGYFKGNVVKGLNYGDKKSVEDLLTTDYQLSAKDSDGWYRVIPMQ